MTKYATIAGSAGPAVSLAGGYGIAESNEMFYTYYFVGPAFGFSIKNTGIPTVAYGSSSAHIEDLTGDSLNFDLALGIGIQVSLGLNYTSWGIPYFSGMNSAGGEAGFGSNVGVAGMKIISGPYIPLDGDTRLPVASALADAIKLREYFAAHPEKYQLLSQSGPELLRPLLNGQFDSRLLVDPRMALDPRTPEFLVPTYDAGTLAIDPRLSVSMIELRTPEVLVPTYNSDGTPQFDSRLGGSSASLDAMPDLMAASLRQLSTFGTSAPSSWYSPAADGNFGLSPTSHLTETTPAGIAGIGFAPGTETLGAGGILEALNYEPPISVSQILDQYVSGSDSNYDYGGSFFPDYVEPVILDLAGAGIKIAQLTSSNMYFDMAGDGLQHRTAWAGAGNGVLVLDLTDSNQVTQRNQVVFTDWDPSAADSVLKPYVLQQIAEAVHGDRRRKCLDYVGTKAINESCP